MADGDGRYHGYPTGNRKQPSSKRDTVKTDRSNPPHHRRNQTDRPPPGFIDPARPFGL